MNKRANGFTLIELSIVLVIIGLIVGGVLVGRQLIVAAQYRMQIAEIEKLNTAINTFKTKYNCLPGDCPFATTLFSSSSNGNGNGHISILCGADPAGGCFGPLGASFQNIDDPVSNDQNAGWMNVGNGGSYYNSEWRQVYHHLQAANLVNFPAYSLTTGNTPQGYVSPLLKFPVYGTIDADGRIANVQAPIMGAGYITGYGYIRSGHKIALGFTPGGTTTSPRTASGINSWDAYAIDNKIDDGMPYTGATVVDTSMFGIYRTAAWNGGAQYCTDGTNYLQEGKSTLDGAGQPITQTCAIYINAAF